MTVTALDLVRRLTAGDLDADHRFSVLLVGTDKLLDTLRAPALEPLRTRFCYVEALRPFSIEDTCPELGGPRARSASTHRALPV
jgi:type II secretory pathway predicted ATPase ExeA